MAGLLSVLGSSSSTINQHRIHTRNIQSAALLPGGNAPAAAAAAAAAAVHPASGEPQLAISMYSSSLEHLYFVITAPGPLLGLLRYRHAALGEGECALSF